MKHKGLEDLAAEKHNCPKGIGQSDWEYLCNMFVDLMHLVFFFPLFSLTTNGINTVLFVVLLDTNCYFVGLCR